jgi:hypothetical protein
LSVKLEDSGAAVSVVRRIRARESQVVLLADRDADVDRIDRRDRREQRVLAATDEVARLHVGLADAPVDRRIDLRVLQVELGVAGGGLCRIEVAFGGALDADGGLVHLPRDRIDGDERFVAGDVLLRPRAVGLGPCELSARLRERGLQISRVDRVQKIAFRNEGALAKIDGLEETFDACPDLDFARAARLANGLHVNGKVALQDGRDLDFGRRGRRRLALAAGADEQHAKRRDRYAAKARCNGRRTAQNEDVGCHQVSPVARVDVASRAALPRSPHRERI